MAAHLVAVGRSLPVPISKRPNMHQAHDLIVGPGGPTALLQMAAKQRHQRTIQHQVVSDLQLSRLPDNNP